LSGFYLSDIKIYGDDALQGLCGEPAHSCTGLKIADFLMHAMRLFSTVTLHMVLNAVAK